MIHHRKRRNGKNSVYFVLSTETEAEYSGDKCSKATDGANLLAGNTFDICDVRLVKKKKTFIWL